MLGKSGIGKTTRLKDLDPASTLFLDIEAGDLAVADWPGDTIRPGSWPESRDFFVFLAGPDRSLPPEAAFSQAHYEHVIEKYGDPSQLERYDTLFVDSITQLSRQCFAWCKTQPGAVSDRTGKPDMRGAYGLLGQEMVGALTHLQLVITAKLRRGEPFPFSWRVDPGQGSGHGSVWISPGVPITFRYAGGKDPSLNREWLRVLRNAANEPGGLRLLPEPGGTGGGGP